MGNNVVLEIKSSRDSEETPEAMMHILESLAHLRVKHHVFFTKGVSISLEIGVINQQIHFFVVTPHVYQDFVTSQIIAHYPRAFIAKVSDSLQSIVTASGDQGQTFASLKVSHGPFLPIKSYEEFADSESLSALLGILAKASVSQRFWIQLLLVPANPAWQKAGIRAVKRKEETTLTPAMQQYEKLVNQKMGHSGFYVHLRLMSGDQTKESSDALMQQLASVFYGFNQSGGNRFSLKKVHSWQRKGFIEAMIQRSPRFVSSSQVLNCAEVATLFHLPSTKLATMPNIAWHKTLL